MIKKDGLVSKLALFALDQPKNRILLVLFFSLIPFGNCLASIIVCLTTLRKGVNEGVIILLWALIPDLLFMCLGTPVPLVLLDINASFVVPFLLAVTLRLGQSWSLVLLLLTGGGLSALLLLSTYFPDYAKSVVMDLQNAMKHFWADKIPYDDVQLQYIDNLTHLIPYVWGVKALFISIVSLSNLIMARGIQALLFNPGGLKKELLSIRLNGLWLLMYLLSCCVWLTNRETPFGIGFLLISSLPFVISGLSLVHESFSRRKRKPSNITIAVMYVMIFFLLYYSLIPLIVVSLIDIIKHSKLVGKNVV